MTSSLAKKARTFPDSNGAAISIASLGPSNATVFAQDPSIVSDVKFPTFVARPPGARVAPVSAALSCFIMDVFEEPSPVRRL